MTSDRTALEVALASRVAELRMQAAAKMAQSVKVRGYVTDDMAYWTQPAYGNAAGRTFARQRDRERARMGKSFEIAEEARALTAKADAMELRGVVVAGDALAAHNAKIAECDVKVGMQVNSIYGWRKVIKVNRKTVLLEGGYGSVSLGKELIMGVAL